MLLATDKPSVADRFSGPGIYMNQPAERPERRCLQCKAPVRLEAFYGFKRPVRVYRCAVTPSHSGHTGDDAA